MRHFFVTGLVRSKTAWMSNLLTWGSSFCWHDFFYGLTGRDHMLYKMHQNEHLQYAVENIGISDPVLVWNWNSIGKEFPEAKWVVIERDAKDCSASAALAFDQVSEDGIIQTQRLLHDLTDEINPLVVRFDRLDRADTCYEVAEYLGIDIGPIARVRQLCDMNIQIHPPILKRRLENLKVSTKFDIGKAA